MPELPEVEVLRRSLERLLPGDRIDSVEVNAPSLREPLDRGALERLAGRRILTLRRRSKYLWIDCEAGLTLVIHLGMSGRFTCVPAATENERHEHLAFQLASGRRLRLVDPRRFGLAFVASTSGLEANPHFENLGLEPFDPAFTGAHLKACARGRRAPAKAFLLTGQAVVGVGNIYASEALWLARIDPRRTVDRIALKRWQSLAEAVVSTLGRAIGQGGTTLNDFTDGLGNAGYFQVSLAVYDREDQACPRCGTAIRRIVQANRSTYFCPRCQH